MSHRNGEIGNEKPTSSNDKRKGADKSPYPTEFVHNDYTVGWVCALPKEQTAATAMLDQIHPDLPKPPNDKNIYTLGSICNHKVVVACLPKGMYGTNSAATVATRMVNTFPSIKIGLMVGIGGGIPPKVRLGDVVISSPVDQYPGVVQWDFGKAEQDGNFKRTGTMNNPPTALLTAVAKLETMHELNGSKIRQYLDDLEKKWPNLVPKYTRSPSLKDPILTADNSHRDRNRCAEQVRHPTTISTEVDGAQRKPGDVCVSYGLIASGNQVIKDAKSRDDLNKSLGGNVLCVEMEAAGLMNDFPCIVIRGICDYADSNKNKDWQEYAAAVAAACAKELLEYVQPSDVDAESPMKDILGEVRDKLSRTEANVDTMRSKLDKKEDLDILNWITPFDYGSQQSEYFRRRQAGTGQWLLDSAKFEEWLKRSQKTLFCPGSPGAGKTILTSVVVHELFKSFSKDLSVGIAYLYCNFRRKDEQKIDDLLASLLKQLSESYSSLPGSVKDLSDFHKAKRTRPSLEEISSTLHSVVAKYSRVFIIIDALDECQASNACQAKLVSELFNLQKRYGANILATSRYTPEIVDQFKGSSEFLEIRASRDDVDKYLEGRIGQLPSFVQDNRQLQTDIKIGISETVDGMFLLAQIYFDSLNDKLTPKAVRNALRGFQKQNPGSSDDEKVQILTHAYDEAVERIDGQMPGYKDLAKKVISWITCAKRPINTTELRHALAVEVGELKLEKENFYTIQDIVSVCAGLVTIDEESNIIRLEHYTTQEYFERKLKHWIPTAETDITKSCVTYLSFSVFNSGTCATDERLEERLQANRLYDYAARNWGHHACAASTVMEQWVEVEHLIQNLLTNEANISAASQAMMVSRSYDGYSQRVPTEMTGVHVAAHFGLGGAIIGLLENGYNPNLQDSYGRTPLSLAAMNGHEAAVELLVKKGAELELENYDGRTPLSLAAKNGHEAVVKLLLEKGAKLEPKDHYGHTPLGWAAKNGHEVVVTLLLKKGAKRGENRPKTDTEKLSPPTSHPTLADVFARTKQKAEEPKEIAPSVSSARTTMTHDGSIPVRSNFGVAVLCTTPFEAEAVRRLFENLWTEDELGGDNYICGSIGGTLVVLLRMRGCGRVEAARSAQYLKQSFPSIRCVLAVGVCCAVSYVQEEVQLGDVILSMSLRAYDSSKLFANGFRVHQGITHQSNQELRTFLERLDSSNSRKRLSKLCVGYLHSLFSEDLEAKYPEHEFSPSIYLGTVFGFTETVIRSAAYGNELARRDRTIAFDATTEGLYAVFDCVVIIKAVCEYTDRHHGRAWVPYAAATAAACTKAFLEMKEEDFVSRPKDRFLETKEEDFVGRPKDRFLETKEEDFVGRPKDRFLETKEEDSVSRLKGRLGLRARFFPKRNLGV